MIYHRHKKANQSEPCVVEWIEISEGEGYRLLAVNGKVVWQGASKYGENSTVAHYFIKTHQEDWAKSAGIKVEDILFVDIDWFGLSELLDPDHDENYCGDDYWDGDYGAFTKKLAEWPPVFKLSQENSHLIQMARGLKAAADKLFLR